MYTFRKLTEALIPDVYIVFKSASKKNISIDKFRKKYNTLYTTEYAIGFLAYDSNNHPVAFFCVIPCYIFYNNKKYLVAQAVDAVTNPKHMRKGLFSKLVQLTTDLAQEIGVEFIFGTPNELSFPPFINKLGWDHNGYMYKIQKKVFTIPFGNISTLHPFFKKIHAKYVRAILYFYKKTNSINVVQDTSKMCIDRSNNFISYKNYTEKYLVCFNTNTYWISINGNMKVGDGFIKNEKYLQNDLKKLKRLAFLVGSKKVVFQVNQNHPLMNLFKPIIATIQGLPIIYFNISKKLDPHQLCLTYADIDTF